MFQMWRRGTLLKGMPQPTERYFTFMIQYEYSDSVVSYAPSCRVFCLLAGVHRKKDPDVPSCCLLGLSIESRIIGIRLSDDYWNSNEAERLFAATRKVRIIRLFGLNDQSTC